MYVAVPLSLNFSVVASVPSIIRAKADLNTFLHPSRTPRVESVDFEPYLRTQDRGRGSSIYALEPFWILPLFLT